MKKPIKAYIYIILGTILIFYFGISLLIKILGTIIGLIYLIKGLNLLNKNSNFNSLKSFFYRF